jgi:hypothetical protein
LVRCSRSAIIASFRAIPSWALTCTPAESAKPRLLLHEVAARVERFLGRYICKGSHRRIV